MFQAGIAMQAGILPASLATIIINRRTDILTTITTTLRSARAVRRGNSIDRSSISRLCASTYLWCFRSFSWCEFSFSPPSDKARIACLGDAGGVWGECAVKFVWGLNGAPALPGWIPNMQYGSLNPEKEREREMPSLVKRFFQCEIPALNFTSASVHQIYLVRRCDVCRSFWLQIADSYKILFYWNRRLKDITNEINSSSPWRMTISSDMMKLKAILRSAF